MDCKSSYSWYRKHISSALPSAPQRWYSCTAFSVTPLSSKYLRRHKIATLWTHIHTPLFKLSYLAASFITDLLPCNARVTSWSSSPESLASLTAWLYRPLQMLRNALTVTIYQRSGSTYLFSKKNNASLFSPCASWCRAKW